MEDSSKEMFQRIRQITLNDLAPEVLVKEKAMKIHGSLEQMRRTRNFEFKESQRLHWNVYIYYSVLISVGPSTASPYCTGGT